ncbi:MAG: isopenicillin N synthase family oxygenase [Calditrichaeota bacterium]|nr:isopenicillin N synthase family oxygenase [Calditrichota bacterium]
MQQIPSLNIQDFSTHRERFVKELGNGYREFGFVAITGHSVPDGLIGETTQSIKDFFDLSPDKKMAYHIKDIGGARGYTPFGVEVAKDSDYPDLKEFWQVGRELSKTDPNYSKMLLNIWPDEIKSFKANCLELYKELDQLGSLILSALALYLNLSEDYFSDKTNLGNSILRAIHYPPVKNAGNSVRSGQHEDINLITLLVGSEQPGLEILTRQNRWIPVTSIKGSIVVNIGDMLQRLTNHFFPSTTHRVINPSGDWASKARYSIPFFLHFNSDFLIKTLDSCVTDSTPDRYPKPILADDYLRERLIEIGLLKN